MALVVTDAGELVLLQKMLKNTSDTDNYILKLYKNNYAPAAGSVAADFTEADFTNYAAKTIARGDWAAPSTVSGSGQSTVAAQSWTCGASTNTIYGYYVIDSADGTTVLWAEQFGVSRALLDGDVLNLTPLFQLSSA
jgi:hypothetical protein